MAWKHRESSAKRLGARWQQTRQRILKRDGYQCRCDMCVRLKRVRIANQVDHRVPRSLGGGDDDANLVAINAACHAEKTIRDRGHKPKQPIGVDGWPKG